MVQIVKSKQVVKGEKGADREGEKGAEREGEKGADSEG